MGPDDKAVLVVAGSWGVGEIDRTFDALAASGRYTPIALCGRNEALRAALAARPGGRAIGWTDQMPSLMAACDAVVQNAGGLTCMEAFAVGLPVVTYLPIPGHGLENGAEMERAGVAAYARRPDQLLPALDRVTGPAGRIQVAAGEAMFLGDAAADVAALVRPRTAPGARRRFGLRSGVAAAAVALVAVWSTLTIGVGAATARGMGMARPDTAGNQIYVGVRPGPSSVADQALAGHLHGTGVTAVIDGSLADSNPEGVLRLADAGIDVANGGWGQHDGFRWQRAPADLIRSCRSLQSADHQPCDDFVPGRRLDGFDLASASMSHQRIVAHPRRLFPNHLPAHLQAGRIYVLDARQLDAPTTTRLVDEIARTSTADNLSIVSYVRLH